MLCIKLTFVEEMGCASSQTPKPKKREKPSNPVTLTFAPQGAASQGKSALVNYDDDSQILSLDDVVKLRREDYGEFTFVQSGACNFALFCLIHFL